MMAIRDLAGRPVLVTGAGGSLVMVAAPADLATHLERRRSGAAVTAGLLTIEGAAPLEGDPANVDVLADAGFQGIRVRPGVDGVSLIARGLLGLAGISSGSWMFVEESPLNLLVEVLTRMLGFETRRRAAIKLLFCGHLVFSAVKVS